MRIFNGWNVAGHSKMKKRVLITGIEGFTGRYVRKEFQNSGWEVYGFGGSEKQKENYFKANLLDIESLKNVVKEVKPHAVVHLAGIAYAAHLHAIDFYNIHVLGTLNFLSVLEEHGENIEKVLLASSANVYGNTEAGVFSESAPLKPFNDYGVSKLAMEYMAWLWREKLPIVIARPFNYSGVGQTQNFLLPKLVWHFQQKKSEVLLGNIDVARDFSDVRSVAYAYRRLIETPGSKGAVNVCSGQAFTIRQVLGVLQDLAGYSIEIKVNQSLIREGEVRILYGSHERLSGLIGGYLPPPLNETLHWMLEAKENDGL